MTVRRNGPRDRRGAVALARRHRPGAIRPWLIAAAALGLLASALVPILARPAGAQAPQVVTVNQLAANPAAFWGTEQLVTVVGEVEDILGWRAFTIEDNDLLFDEELLVVSARPLLDRHGRTVESAFLGDDDIRVSGTVRAFNLAEFERELGVDLEDDLFTAWTGRPAIIAHSIYVPPR
jgi:hypothetical protein